MAGKTEQGGATEVGVLGEKVAYCLGSREASGKGEGCGNGAGVDDGEGGGGTDGQGRLVGEGVRACGWGSGGAVVTVAWGGAGQEGCG